MFIQLTFNLFVGYTVGQVLRVPQTWIMPDGSSGLSETVKGHERKQETERRILLLTLFLGGRFKF